MRRWFLSYNSQDLALMQGLEAALRRKDPDANIYFAPKTMRAGGFWLPELAKALNETTAFVLLVGKNGLGPWQVIEYYEALDRRVKAHAQQAKARDQGGEPHEFPVVLVLLEGTPAPGLPFLTQLHWIVTPDPASEQSIARLMDAAEGSGSTPGQLWRHTAPYRGLAAMTEADADFFFGRVDKTVEVINALEAGPDKLPVLLGNSGVGKSSLAQAGVLSCLRRQSWPETANAGAWPQVFRDSRGWCFLTLRPGAEPIKALVEAFLETWQFDAGDPARIKQRNEWVELLLDENRKTNLPDLLDETERRHKELNQSKPPAFFLYVDQGEELYVRAEERQRRRFSEILARALGDPRLRAMLSMRADFFGDLQKDEPLYAAHRLVSVPPLRETQLREVVSRPAELLSARFETDRLAADIARRTAEESAKDAGDLPLLSYLLDDMWTQMVKRGDGVLRLPPAAMEIGGVLALRANTFLARNPMAEEALRRLLTVKLATVREGSQPTRRRALRSEFSDAEWRLISELADHPNRLLVTATPEDGEPYAEVAHETIFKRWDKLKVWIEAEREFLVWRGELEARRKDNDKAREAVRKVGIRPLRKAFVTNRQLAHAPLMGLPLDTAKKWLAARRGDIDPADRAFIVGSVRSRRVHLALVVILGVLGSGALMGLPIALVLGAVFKDQIFNYFFEQFASPVIIPVIFMPHVLTPETEQALKPGDQFRECSEVSLACPEMIVIPAGEFWMGSPDGEGFASERPRHKVKIAQPFAVGKFEVTWDEWDSCVKMGGCERLPNSPYLPDHSGFGKGSQPLINVSFDQAKAYVAWLSRMTGKTYRLVTESEWEYAARGVTSTDAPHPPYPWGDKASHEYANYGADQCCSGKIEGRDNWFYTAPVGQFPPNGFGAHDMHGNVLEWVEDPWHDDYSGTAPTDGRAWTEGADAGLRVVRGGSWVFNPEVLRSAYRYKLTTDTRINFLGFRVARTLGP